MVGCFEGRDSVLNWVKGNFYIVPFVGVCAYFVCFLSILLVLHLFLIINNLTTCNPSLYLA